MRYDKIPSELFVKNRKRFTEKMKPNSIAVFYANAIMPRSADSSHIYRPNPDLYYLCGVDQEETFLLLNPSAEQEEMREILFLRETNEHIAVWEGEKLTKETGAALSGISNIRWNDGFEGYLNSIIGNAEHVYLNLNENDRAEKSVPTAELLAAQKLQATYPLHKYERSGPIMAELRAIKQDEEIAVIQHACNITEQAFRKVLRTLKPGMMEYEVESHVIQTFIANKAEGHAYTPIIASGGNACVLHYIQNNRECKDGDMLLMDFGSNYAHYASDLSRTIPVNGKFTDRQKEVYNACLRVHNYAKEHMVAGESLNQFNLKIREVMAEELIGLGLIEKDADDATKKKLTGKYYPHGTSHFMGIDVHDIGNRYAPIEEGMCFTIEPGIYIREENIGIRIENDIIVKKGGNIDLMKNIPITVEEIEALMAEN